MTPMGNKVMATQKVSLPASTAGGYPILPVAPYEAAMTPPASHGNGPTRSPGEGTGVYGQNSKIGR